MRRLTSAFCALFSIAITALLFVAMLGFVAFGTTDGRDFVRAQAERALGGILGPNFAASLGAQSIEFDRHGTFRISWSDVSVLRRDAGAPVSKIASIKVGLDILPLVTGHLAIRTLEISGARIDLTQASSGDPAEAATPASTETGNISADQHDHLRRIADRGLAEVERRLADIARIGVETVVFSDIRLTAPIAADGGPFVARIERASFRMAQSGQMILSCHLVVDRLDLRISGNAEFDPVAGRLQVLRATAGPIALGTVLPPAPSDDRRDIRPFATDAPVTVTAELSSDRAGGPRTMRLGLGIEPGAVQTGRGHTKVERTDLAITYREGEDEIAIADGRIAFDGFSMVLAGRLSPVYDAPGTKAFNGFGFRLEGDPMRSVIGADDAAASPRTARLALEGRTSLSDKTITVSRFDLKTDGGTLSGTATYGFATDTALTQLQLRARDLAAADVKAFWPYSIAVNTRRWVMANIGDAGRVTTGSIDLAVAKNRLAVAFAPGRHAEPNELQLLFDVEGVTLSGPGDLPKLVDAAAHIETRGGGTIVTVRSARVEGYDRVSVTGGTLRFDPAADEALQEIDASLSLDMAGDIAGLLGVAENKPLDVLRALDFSPQDAQGTASLTAQLFFVLGDDVARDRQIIGYDVMAKIDDAGLKVPIEGRRLSGLSGLVHIVPGAVSAEVAGRIDGIAAKISIARPFGDNPAVERRLEVTASIDGEVIAALVPALSDAVGGDVGARLIEEAPGRLRAEIDLSNARLQLPVIGWRKGPGVAAALGFDIAREGGDTILKNMVLKGDSFSARGTIRADKDGLEAADFSSVAFNPGDDVAVKLQRVSNGISVRIEGPSFDARPFLQDLKDSLGAKTDAKPERGGRQLDIGVAIDRLTGFGSERLDGFSANYAGSGGQIAALSISARTSGGAGFSADVSPRGEARSIKVRAGEAGRIFSFAGLYGRMKGGALSLDLIGSAQDGYRGTLVCDDFTLVDEPRLSSIVGTSRAPNGASLSQALGTDIRTENAAFDHASAGIVYGKGGLRVSDGIIRGPVFGSSFSGTVYDARNRIDIVGSFMPAYGLNGIFRDIPLVGQILGNGNEGGIIGITYKLDGAFAAPKLTVNPISAIAPGIFRSIFAYQ